MRLQCPLFLFGRSRSNDWSFHVFFGSPTLILGFPHFCLAGITEHYRPHYRFHVFFCPCTVMSGIFFLNFGNAQFDALMPAVDTNTFSKTEYRLHFGKRFRFR